MTTWTSTDDDMVVVWITKRKSGSPAMNSIDNRRKRTAREAHKASADTQKMFGHKAKLHHAKRHSEKIQMKKQLKAHDERNVKQKDDGAVQEGALPTYLLDREGQKVSQAYKEPGLTV
jgi:ribosome biogenesis protein NSA2